MILLSTIIVIYLKNIKMGCGRSIENKVAEPVPKCPVDSMAFLIQRTHAQGTNLSEHRAKINRMDIIDQMEPNA